MLDENSTLTKTGLLADVCLGFFVSVVGLFAQVTSGMRKQFKLVALCACVFIVRKVGEPLR